MREFLARKKVGANAIKSLTKRVTELSREAGHQDDITFDEDAILELNDDKVKRCYTAIHRGNENRWTWFTDQEAADGLTISIAAALIDPKPGQACLAG